MTRLQLGFKETEARETFRQRLTTFFDGAIVEPQVRGGGASRALAHPHAMVADRLHHL